MTHAHRAFLLLCLIFLGTATLSPAQAQSEPTAAQIAIARDIVTGSGMSRSFETMIPTVMDQITQTLTQTRPELSADLKKVLAEQRPEFEKQIDEIMNTAASILARRMNEKELTDTAAFFKSASGKKYVETQPASLDELVVALQGWSQKLSTIMFEKVRAEMKKKGHDL